MVFGPERRRLLTAPRSVRTAHGPRLKGRETRFTDRHPVCRLVLLQQPVADQ